MDSTTDWPGTGRSDTFQTPPENTIPNKEEDIRSRGGSGSVQQPFLRHAPLNGETLISYAP
jgi:beta-lactam-binding protein with PASTA domain